MNAEPAANACPSCGGDRISIIHTGELYCVDCNRKQFVFPANTTELESAATADHSPLPKAA